MNRRSMTVIAAVLLAAPVAADAAEWLHDFDAALRVAKEGNKPIFLNFGGPW